MTDPITEAREAVRVAYQAHDADCEEHERTVDHLLLRLAEMEGAYNECMTRSAEAAALPHHPSCASLFNDPTGQRWHCDCAALPSLNHVRMAEIELESHTPDMRAAMRFVLTRGAPHDPE